MVLHELQFVKLCDNCEQALKRFLTLFVILLLLAGCSVLSSPSGARGAASPTAPSTPADAATASITRVLFLGNSYTYGNDLPEMFAGLATSAGHHVEVGMVAEGGWRLSDHARSPETLDRLKSTRWTFVVLQEQSQIPAVDLFRTRDMYPAARKLAAQIREGGAIPLFFLTWAHRDGWPEYGLSDYESMQIEITKAYSTIAQELNAPVAPVGAAWLTTVKEYPDLNLWREDGSHPRKQGTYLAACVFYATIFHETPKGLAYRAGLSNRTARTLQNIAAETVPANP